MALPISHSLPSLTHVFVPKTLTVKRNPSFLASRRSDYFEAQKLASRPPPEDSLPASQPSRVYVGYSIYKGKAALTSGAFKVSKEGFALMQFAPAVGTRQYDWSRKQVFSLSVVEMGTLMSLGAKDSCEFFHDPFKGRSDEGKVRKLLKAEPLPDGTGHFFNLSVQNRLLNVDESIYIPISKAEFTILNSSFNFIVPYLLGWHAFANTIKPEDSVHTNNSISRSGAELEWGR
ncbi:hypothetical protein J5N97_013376 [Dioscorea zingiberensis]|uniref:Uncharacterized protein n=1 Tax=Dioscorea zingiberensis TaxID=325984 RepID=A0A9D5CS20_9LILI|nr:hypothetical protein J5N97_013376 [Dioscorea zingiberensis]